MFHKKNHQQPQYPPDNKKICIYIKRNQVSRLKVLLNKSLCFRQLVHCQNIFSYLIILFFFLLFSLNFVSKFFGTGVIHWRSISIPNIENENVFQQFCTSLNEKYTTCQRYTLLSTHSLPLIVDDGLVVKK